MCEIESHMKQLVGDKWIDIDDWARNLMTLGFEVELDSDFYIKTFSR